MRVGESGDAIGGEPRWPVTAVVDIAFTVGFFLLAPTLLNVTVSTYNLGTKCRKEFLSVPPYFAQSWTSLLVYALRECYFAYFAYFACTQLSCVSSTTLATTLT